MKAEIHPNFKPTKFICTCGNILETFSNLGGEKNVDICSSCHPFFSGKEQRMIDTTGRVEKFRRRYQRS
jgi:large subunit ribosomal protein L31